MVDFFATTRAFSMDATSNSETPKDTLYDEINTFFESAPPLKDGPDIRGRGASRVVCVTSGGTTVPLEKRCVRYIDNFSSGGFYDQNYRYFLKAGYSVIFLSRRAIYAGELASRFVDLFQKIHCLTVLRGTCQPFCRSLPEDPLLECFEVSKELNVRGLSYNIAPIHVIFLIVCQSHSEAVRTAIGEHCAAVEGGLLLKLPFTTIFEYLQILQLIAMSMKNLGTHAMFYLAAAVSDFYVPWKSMVEHKIQSSSGPLDMRLVQVPKMLSVLRKDWAPVAFCISFKLETDSKILLEKAEIALKKYNMHAVVANELLTRKEVVVVVTSSEKISVHRDKTEASADVESPLIELLAEKHSSYIEHLDS
ncbi:hypothetical protein TEA_026977 [Camellia sinensis var. sinensis]|uniref:DNA/pantothenate metabolism flavoprotein C-terminal domain-containing protein n=1 Tax=Camellia sinensis var. sinensis TaxID=542762 RepID=A0A4S4F0J3_CAMSN|nr:hypothetical protein TEA_026977 [Camellia sinensis var. sinensis]